MVIYSTLIDAATEHVEIFGKAGSTTIREIKIDNPQDSTIVLFIEKVSFTIKNYGDQGSTFTVWSEMHDGDHREDAQYFICWPGPNIFKTPGQKPTFGFGKTYR